MRFIKKHINLFVFIGVIILIILGVVMAKNLFFPSETTAIYGTRLEGRNKVKIKDETKNKIKEALSENTENVTVRVQGKIIYVVVKGKAELSLDTAKSFSGKILENLTDEEKAFYDIQLLVENDANTNQFPIIGYKQHTKTDFVWTKDRG